MFFFPRPQLRKWFIYTPFKHYVSHVPQWALTSQHSDTLLGSLCMSRSMKNEVLQAVNGKRKVVKGKGKGKFYPIKGHEGPEVEQRYSSTLSLTLALDGSRWSTPRPGRFTPGKDPVPIVQKAGWAPGPDRTGAKILALTGIRFPDRERNIIQTAQ